MKKIHLMFNQTKKLTKTHKVFSLMLITAQIVGILILLFSAATIQSISVKQKEIDQYTLYFEVDMLRYLDETEEVIIGYAEENNKKTPVYGVQQKLDLSGGLSIDELSKRVKKIIAESPIATQPDVRISGRYNNYKIATFMYSNYEISDGEVSLNEKTFPEYNKGDNFQLGNRTLKIKDISKNQVADIVVANSSLPDEWIGLNVRFSYETAPTTEQAEKMKELLLQNFDCNAMHIPESVDPLTAQFHATAILCTIIMLIAVLLNICYAQLFRFRLEKHTFAVFRLVGGDLKTICSICLSEVLLSSMSLYSISVLVFHCILRRSVAVWYEGINSLYTPKYYIIFGISYLLFQLILISIPLNRFINKEVVDAEKEAY